MVFQNRSNKSYQWNLCKNQKLLKHSVDSHAQLSPKSSAWKLRKHILTHHFPWRHINVNWESIDSRCLSGLHTLERLVQFFYAHNTFEASIYLLCQLVKVFFMRDHSCTDLYRTYFVYSSSIGWSNIWLVHPTDLHSKSLTGPEPHVLWLPVNTTIYCVLNIHRVQSEHTGHAAWTWITMVTKYNLNC